MGAHAHYLRARLQHLTTRRLPQLFCSDTIRCYTDMTQATVDGVLRRGAGVSYIAAHAYHPTDWRVFLTPDIVVVVPAFLPQRGV